MSASFRTPIAVDDTLGFLERRVLDRGRWFLAQVVAFECSPAHIARSGRSGFDVAGAFPGTIVSTVDLADPRTLQRADVVWCDFAFAGSPDPARTIATLWEGMRSEAVLAVVDVHRVHSERMERWLGKELGLRRIPGLLGGLRVSFAPIHTSVLEHSGGAWQSVVMVGRKRAGGDGRVTPRETLGHAACP